MDPRQILKQRQIKLDLERRRLLLDEESFKIQQELAALGQHQASIYTDSEDSHVTLFPKDQPQPTPKPQEDCLVIDLTHEDENVQVKLEPPDHGVPKNPEISLRQNQDQPRITKSHDHTRRINTLEHLRALVFNDSTPNTPDPPTKQPLPLVSRHMTNNTNKDMTTAAITKPSKIVVLKLPKHLVSQRRGPYLRPDEKTATPHSQSKLKSDILPSASSSSTPPPNLSYKKALLASPPVIKSRSASDPIHARTARRGNTRNTQPSSRLASKRHSYAQELKTELAALRSPSSPLPLASPRRPRLPAGYYCSPGTSDSSSDISMEEPYCP